MMLIHDHPSKISWCARRPISSGTRPILDPEQTCHTELTCADVGCPPTRTTNPTGTTPEPAQGAVIGVSIVDCDDIVCGNHNQVLL
jgi:hypothetical protein